MRVKARRRVLIIGSVVAVVAVVLFYYYQFVLNRPIVGNPEGYPPFKVPDGVDIILLEDYVKLIGDYYIINMSCPCPVVVAYGGGVAEAEKGVSIYPLAISLDNQLYVVVGIASKRPRFNISESGWVVSVGPNGGYVFHLRNGVIWCLDYRGNFSGIYVWLPSKSCSYLTKYVVTVDRLTGKVYVNGYPANVVSAKAARWGGWLAVWVAKPPGYGSYAVNIK